MGTDPNADTNTGRTESADDLLGAIRERGPLEGDAEIERALAATMETLGERLTDGEAEDLAASLPAVAADPLVDASPGEAEPFSATAFLDRVADRTDLDERISDDLERDPVAIVRAVLDGVREVADPAELERAREQLPREFDLLFEPGEPMAAGDFLEIVDAELPGDAVVDPHTATEGTIETLGERITGGQAGDLATYLPHDLRSHLAGVDEDATPMAHDEFLERVADRAGAADERAPDVVRAVLAATRETAAERELEKVRSQLPDEFDPLFDAAA